MIDRRKFLGAAAAAAAAGASLVLTPEFLRALQRTAALQQSAGALIRRAIPSSGETLPAVGLSFSNHPACADHGALKAVLQAFAENGCTLFDAMHVNPAAEQFHITAARELGIERQLFWTTRGSPAGVAPQPGAAFVNGHIDSLLSRINVPKLDLAMIPVTADPTHLAALKDEKKAGRVRYIGVQTISVTFQAAQLEAIMRNEPIDLIGVDYDIGNRFVEDTILPLAQERKIGVIAYFPFGNNGGVSCGSGLNLFARVGDRPLPEWAAEFDAKSWAQFFSKYVIGHPGITVARVGTSKPHHMLDNVAGGSGRLPTEAMRKRMAELIETFPAPTPPVPPSAQPGIAVATAVLDRYVGEYKATTGSFVATFRREGDRLFAKPGNNPEVPLNARTETRFQDPRGPIFEFQLDAQGNVTGAVLEQQGPQGTQKLALERK